MISLIFLIISLNSMTNGANILFLVPFPSPSHWFLLQNFVKELVIRGHTVTSVVSKPISNFASPNYTEILIDPPFDLDGNFPSSLIYELGDQSDFGKVRDYELVSTPSSEYGLQNPKVQALIHSTNIFFDLVINEDFYHDSWLMFGYKFKVPTITICPYGHTDFFDRAMGLLTPWSFVPHHILSYDDEMTYTQRIYNVILSLYDWWFHSWIVSSRQNEIAQRYFSHLVGNSEKLPSVEELYRGVSVIMVHSHRLLNKPRPMMPGIVNIGGCHIKPPKRLSNELQEYLDKSTNGVIIFSMGSLIPSAQMPIKQRDAFLTVFGRLKQNVIWKFEDDSMPNIPSNVRIQNWLPQSDILAHPNVVLFITHGGMSSTFEGMARGVPMLCIPVFADQHRNSYKLGQLGIARTLSIEQVNEEQIFAELNELLQNEEYTAKAKEVGDIFNDNIMHPMDEAMYWIEHVIKSNGAKYLKSKAVNLCWFQYVQLDIWLLPFALLLTLYLLIKITIGVIRVIRKRNMSNSAV